ncbi:MAG: hypothetical protein WBF43_14475 [Methylocella sp.]
MKHLPPRGTHFDDLALGACDGALDRIHPALYEEGREQSEREASPTGGIIDSHRPNADFAWPRLRRSYAGLRKAADANQAKCRLRVSLRHGN